MKTIFIVTLILSNAVTNHHTTVEGEVVKEINWHGGFLDCLAQAEVINTTQDTLNAECELTPYEVDE